MRQEDAPRRVAIGGAAVLAVVAVILFMGTALQAADHTEPPAISNNQAADIGDLYAWHDGGNLVAVLTFAGPAPPAMEQGPTYSRDVLYGIHVDNNDDQEADIDIWARFARDGDGNWGMQIQGLPGANGPMVGAVGQMLSPEGNDAKIWSGLREDPFFFDLQGFNDSVSNQSLTDMDGNLFFDSSRDFFAGKNITALVVEVPLADVKGNGDILDIWATTSLFSGGGSQ